MSGAAGAFLVAVFTIFYTEIREARGGVRETAGLARLLIDEVERNEEIIQVLPPSAENIDRFREILSASSMDIPGFGAWVETRVRLAQGLEHGDFEAVADYYQFVTWMAIRLQADRHSPKSISRSKPIPKSDVSW